MQTKNVFWILLFVAVVLLVGCSQNQQTSQLTQSKTVTKFYPVHEFEEANRILSLKVYQDKLYAATDQGLYSYDGSSWMLTNHPIKNICDLTVYKDKLFTSSYGGSNDAGQVYSFDGKSWALEFDPRETQSNIHQPDPCDVPYAFNTHIGVSDLSDYIEKKEDISSHLYMGRSGSDDLYEYDGSEWKSIQKSLEEMRSNLFSTSVYENELYMAVGELFSFQLVPKSILVYRNQWMPLDNSPEGLIHSLITYNNNLYAFGSIAEEKSMSGAVFSYNGKKWQLIQSFPSEFPLGIGPSTIYNNKLFIGTLSYSTGDKRAPAIIYSS